MPEVLRIIARLNLGGPARHVVRIAAPLQARGWRTVLATGQVEPGEEDIGHEAREAGLEVITVPGLARSPRPGSDLTALLALRRLVARRRPALVHTHTAKAGVLGRLAAGRGGPPLVHTYHGHVLSGYFGPLASRAAALTEAWLARRSARLVAVSAAVRDELLHEHGVGRPEQYRLVPPGIDPERTAADPEGGAALRRDLGLPEDALLVGMLGRLVPIKGLDVLTGAWEALARSEPRAHLLVLGAGPEGERLASRLGALPRVHRQGPRRHLGAVWGALDLLALPSRREGLPQTVVEALRAGVPVVGSAVGGVPELVRDGVDGLLVPPEDEGALARALGRALADDTWRRDARRAARERDWTAHEPVAVAHALADLYDELAGRHLETVAPAGHPSGACTSSS